MELFSLYRDIVEDSPDGIWVTDLDGRTLYANEAFARLYGAPLDEVATLTVFDVLDEAGKLQYAEHLRAARAGHQNEADVETYFIDAHGHGTWVSVREHVLRHDDADVAIVNRISSYGDRRQVLDELRASREALQEAQGLARIGTWTYDFVTGRASVFGGADVGRAVDSLTGPDEILSLVHPDDVRHVERVTRRAIAGSDEFEADLRVDTDGAWSYVRVRGLVRRAADGRPTTLTGTHQDITAMREVELALRDEVVQSALMRRIAAAANAAHSLVDALAIVRPLLSHHDDWIRSTAFRVDPSGELDPLDRDIWPEEEALCRSALTERAPVWSDDQRTLAFRVGTLERIYAVGTITASEPLERRDLVETMAESVAIQLARVAEREESRHELAAARDAAMAASRQKSDFLTTMSHEIRTPLNGIIGLTELLRRTRLDAEQERLTSGLHAAGHTLLTVLNDVLDFSKLDGRPAELEHVDVEVRALVDQVARVLAGATRSNGVELVVSCDASVPALVLGDPTRISQVLTNLVSNAVKFSPQGEVLVQVSAVDADADQVCLLMEVSDNGIGIDAERLERLFEPFTQADASTTRRFGGTGLGLSIARETSVALGGTIAYRPNPEGGSVFSFSVWCDRHTESATKLDAYARVWLGGRRVLVADSSAPRAAALLEQLRWWGVEVDVAEDVARAGVLLERSLRDDTLYEAVLIDARVTGGGMALVGDIAGETAYDAVAMIMIGSDLDVDLGRLREAGVSVLLERPIPADTLRGTLLEQLVGVSAEPVGVPEAPPPGSGSVRVLVVEDNVVNQIVARGLLASLGYQVEIAQNGAEALDVLARETFDAVLMDVQMPVLDGYAATRALREREPAGTHLPVIAMTAAAIVGERERCLAAGMDEFLTKPVDRAALAQALDRWIVPREEKTMSDTPADPEPVLPPTSPIAGLDTDRLDMLRDLDPGDTSYIDRAIANFQTNSLAAESAIADLVAAGDHAGLRAAAHKIAGSALNLGVPRAGEAARALEQLADAGTTAGASELMAELRAAMAEGRALLLAYQATYSS